MFKKIIPWKYQLICMLNVTIVVLRAQKAKSYSTQYSQVVPHLSTNYANTSLTSEIGRDLVLSSVYGHN